MATTDLIQQRSDSNLHLVTVIIPCYNQGIFLREALQSCQVQTYRPLEVIVVDDGSDVDTKQAISELTRQFSFRLVTKENEGLSAARNTGVNIAQGAYILPLDADNQLAPDAIRQMVDLLRSTQKTRPQVMFVYQDKTLFGAEERYVPHQPYNLYRLLSDNFADACSLIDRKVFDCGLRYNETMRQGYEDWEFHLRLGVYGWEGVRLPGRTFFYRRWGYSMVNAADTQKQHLMQKIRKELAALYVPSIVLQIKQQWAPSLYMLSTTPTDTANQTLRDMLATVFPERPEPRVWNAACSKYLVFWLVSPDKYLQTDPSILEKWVTLGEHRADLNIIVLVDGSRDTVGYWVRSAYLAQHADCTPSNWHEAFAILNSLPPTSCWNLERQRFTQTPTTTNNEDSPKQKWLSVWLKKWGKRYVAPRLGFDNAYAAFYHSYQAISAIKRGMHHQRPEKVLVQIPDRVPDEEMAGELIDQGFRHYTPTIFQGVDDNA